MNHGFIGYGNLSSAIYKGLRGESNLHFAYFSRGEKEDAPKRVNTLDELVSFADIVWLTVRPQDLANVLKQIAPLDRAGKIFISPVAGKKINFIEGFLGKEQAIVRIMPNLAIAYRKSVTAISINSTGSHNSESLIQLLTKLGKVVKLHEDSFDLFTSVFGSGPAFILAFIQIFKEKMVEFNLPGSLLDSLLLELMEGTVTYFSKNQKEKSIEELIENITSRGGTTQAGLDHFHKHNIGKEFEGVLNAASKRSKEMELE